ncbi:MAG TPA: peptidoglycan-binding protein [Oscillospiraceae bacterium]|nr:peptidoglycan-binding protein [Oscillospiraceae bacterium]HNW04319.1 peptidoglycan-binding protein [Oscillospiraceae bacterium]HPV99509.1 peptidoglycan-binding protein [Oscillospiraceae bacterium]
MDETCVCIPEFITVHLGAPDENAANITVPFPDYIKNVASCGLYPTWPESSLRANICAEITFALSRLRARWYRNRGYCFDITSTAEHDQKFVRGKACYACIGRIVDAAFNEYIVRDGSREPCDAVCGGSECACGGMSQWGTVTLANQGYQPRQILQYYYGEDVALARAAVPSCGEDYPGYPLEQGLDDRNVEYLQRRLNRIGQNYPTIPLIDPADGLFDKTTEQAVRRFQQIFGMTPDGIVGPATWYRICGVYASMKRLSDLYREGILLSEIPKQCPGPIFLGQRGRSVILLRFYINMIAAFYQEIGPVEPDGGYDKAVKDQVLGLQKLAGLAPNGVVDEKTWDEIYSVYAGIMENVPQKYFQEASGEKPAGRYPGYDLREMEGVGDEQI